MTDCPYCDRECPRCKYPIDSGWVHVVLPQPEGSNVRMCKAARFMGPVVDVMVAFFTHMRHALEKMNDQDEYEQRALRVWEDEGGLL